MIESPLRHAMPAETTATDAWVYMRVFGIPTWTIFFVSFSFLAAIVLALDAFFKTEHSPTRRNISFVDRAADNLGVLYRMLVQTGRNTEM